MQITRARSSDGEALDDLMREVLSGTTLEEEREAPHRSIWVARSSSAAPLGFCVCRQILDETEILALAVLPRERRSGVGKALLAHLIDAEVQRGTGRLTLEVKSTNHAARALYRAAGFEEFARRARYYRDGCDALELELRLNADASQRPRPKY